MANDSQVAVGERSGVPFYKSNPSIPQQGEVQTRSRNSQIAKGGQAMILNGTGDVLGPASVAFMRKEEVDQTRFVKLYYAGVQRLYGLGKAGGSVFDMVFKQMQLRPNDDRVALSAHLAKEEGIEQRTYNRGLRELLDHEVLFASLVPSVFFVNIKFVFNGNRLHFIETYYLAGSEREARLELGMNEEDK